MKSGRTDRQFSLSTVKWNDRFNIQAEWTAQARNHLYRLCNLNISDRILEVGCGTGAVWRDFFQQSNKISTLHINKHSRFQLFGLDRNPEFLRFAGSSFPESKLIHGDAHNLPYKSRAFDLTFCHFFLLWVSDPIGVIHEMIRVTKSGGNVIVMAEPDHRARLDYPEQLELVGKIQTESLSKQGADIQMGRKIGGILHDSGLKEIMVGLLGGTWRPSADLDDWKSEWETLEEDLKYVNPPADFLKLRELDRIMRINGHRLLYVPTFYAHGVVA